MRVRAHYDGKQIVLDEPCDLKPHARLIITVLDDQDAERHAWSLISIAGLSNAYSASEIEYPLDMVKEANPDYEGR